ncbi:MAG: ThuA domain-containing protein [Clostridiales bacterium]|jgi:type 1 glutamine amidotransferase|nr:ThuA domain-containing protein [Clostridiales bacterium]
MRKALIFQGGWDGHEPELVSRRFERLLAGRGFDVAVSGALDCLNDAEALCGLDLLVASWTMGEIKSEQAKNVARAVGKGVGLAGCHGGMCDSFRANTEWQFMTGGQWVSHPGGDGVGYTVNIRHGSSPITEGIGDFEVASEHYYLHVDPAVEVLATTRFPIVPYYHISNRPVDMPVAWTKFWGNGRVFYSSLGHHDDVFDKSPQAQALMLNGMLWAAAGRQRAEELGLTDERFLSEAKMY